jgi:glycine/D-amino acid oxidase-like deaminating enzyme
MICNAPANWSRDVAQAGLIRTPCRIVERSTANADAGMTLTPRASSFAAKSSEQPDSTWLGFRPSLPGGLPVIGQSSASPPVVYAFGRQHLGVTLGGVTGSVVADLVAGALLCST